MKANFSIIIFIFLFATTHSSVSEADFMSKVANAVFEVKLDGSNYRYVMKQDGVIKWESDAYPRAGQEMSGSPLAPTEIAEDLTLGAATDDLMLRSDGTKYYIGSLIDGSRKPLSTASQMDLRLVHTVKARANPLHQFIDKYRKEVTDLQNQLSSCRTDSRVPQEKAGK